MEPRTLVRFGVWTIVMHWLHVSSFFVLMVTGSLLFTGLADFGGAHQLLVVHRATAVVFLIAPVLYALIMPASAASFVKEAFSWSSDDKLWLKSSLKFYFGSNFKMPPQGRINGDQKLWQFIVIITGVGLAGTGIVLWFFKLDMARVSYEWVRIAHDSFFVLLGLTFAAHFYVRTLHPVFGESLSSMIDGKVSDAYAKEHYLKWYDKIVGGKPPS